MVFDVLVFLSQVFGPRDNECSISAQGQITTVAIFTISDIQGAFIILLVSLCVNKIAKCYPCSGWDHNVLLLVCPGEVGGEAGKEGSCFRAWETESLIVSGTRKLTSVQYRCDWFELYFNLSFTFN